MLGEPGPRLMAINGDEGEPGTFKDRWYLETDPHRFIEGMLIGAHVVEAPEIYIYLRDEYPASREILEREIAKLPPGGPVLHMRRGAGAYICGEESALLESIEGKRGLPRHKPPYPFQVGLFGLPTLINNIETLWWVRDIVEKGADWWKSHGRNDRHGLRSYSVSGRVKNPGMKLAPAGVTVRELIDEFCGGMAEGHTFHAYLPGGASGGILPAAMDDIPLDFGTLEKYGCFIGSAAVIILSDQDDVKGCGAEPDALLRGRELRPVHALPRRHPEGGAADGTRRMEPRIAGRIEPGDARRVDLRTWPGGLESAHFSD